MKLTFRHGACLACLAGLAFALTLAGCESMSDATTSVREKFAERNAPQTRSYPAAQRPVFDAAKVAAEQMGYRITRSGASQGIVEAVSGVRLGDGGVGSSRQLSMKVKLDPSLDGGTTVSVRITEISESDSSNKAGLATERPLKDTPQYEVFFQRVDAALKAEPAKS